MALHYRQKQLWQAKPGRKRLVMKLQEMRQPAELNAVPEPVREMERAREMKWAREMRRALHEMAPAHEMMARVTQEELM